MVKKVNIINILTNYKNNKMKIEISYKTYKNINAKICLLINGKEKNYSSNTRVSNDECNRIILSSFELDIKPQNIKILINEKETYYNTAILDNKEQKIMPEGNEYKIFINKYSIKIKDEEIEIKRKKCLEKLKYKIGKQIYSKDKYNKFCLYRILKRKPKYYLFNDRIQFGDDNAEELFKYINTNNKKMAKRCYFVLDKHSDRIKELKKIGKVLKFGSFLHKIKYINAKMVISSHSSYYDRVYNPFDEKEMFMYKDIINKKFVFLQHGVIMNDVHNILNRTRTIADLFITTTNDEYEIVSSPLYLYEKKMITCAGLARFDKLQNKNKNIILIAPTWRAFLTEVEYSNEDKNEFINSEFYFKYKQLLSNIELQKIIQENNYKIKFLLHPVFEKYRKEMQELENENLRIVSVKDIKYSELFDECSIFITDYSSTHFDVAYLQKPIIYYQFDKERFFSSHYKKGYFDYEKDGFGQVIEEEKEIVDKIIFYINNNCKPEEKYLKRIKETFKFLDKNNCERIYKQIKLIDKDEELNYRFNNVH